MKRRRFQILAIVALAGLATALSALYVTPFRKALVGIPALRQAVEFAYHRGAAPPDLEWLGEGGPATQIRLHDPSGLAEDASGGVYIADRGQWWGLQVVWRIGGDGVARAVAGNAHRGYAPEGPDARQAALGQPEGLAVDDLGRLYIADAFNNVLVRIETDGGLTRAAGTGSRGFAGDGGPAAQALLNQPFDVRIDAQGNVYVCDFGNHRVRVIAGDGTIRTVAGTGEPGYSGDGGPATAARLNGPYGIFVDAQGRLWIADSGNHVVRLVGRDGNIETVAGVGTAGHTGDGGPAREAHLDGPQALFVDRAGGVYIDDEHNHAIRFVAPDGTISNLIGTGTAGYSADGVAAQRAQLNDPESLLIRSSGEILISEGDNGVVRVLRSDGRLGTFAGRR